MPTTVKAVAKELGLSERTAQRWVSALRQYLDGAIHQEGRRVVLSDDAVEVLRQIRRLRQDGVTFQEAIAKVLGIEEDVDVTPAPRTSPPRHKPSRQWKDVAVIVALVELGLIAIAILLLAIRTWVQ